MTKRNGKTDINGDAAGKTSSSSSPQRRKYRNGSQAGNSLRYALRNAAAASNDTDHNPLAVDQLDGVHSKRRRRTNDTERGEFPNLNVNAEGESEEDVSDTDSVTVRNTRANERTKRVIRGTLSSPTGSATEEDTESSLSPERHVNFADEAHSVRVLAGHKAALHNPRASEETKVHARELLEFHGENCD